MLSTPFKFYLIILLIKKNYVPDDSDIEIESEIDSDTVVITLVLNRYKDQVWMAFPGLNLAVML